MKAKIIAKKCKNEMISQIFYNFFAAISYNKDVFVVRNSYNR